jgi:hypothetical protein
MNPSQPVSPRRRLQELLAIPDSQRTEAQWDELNELEIKLAPGNRESPSDSGGSRDGQPQGHGHGQGQGQGQGRQNPRGGGGNNPQGKRPARKFHKRAPKPGNGGNPGGNQGGGNPGNSTP